MPNDMNDDDIFLVFHRPTPTDRYVAIRYPWNKLKQYFMPGPKGDTGPKGDQGIQGTKGDTGPQGPQGLPGAKGDTGSQGLKGDTGSQGPKGDTGSQGASGSQGIQGLQGVKGDTGAAGTPKRVERYTATTDSAGLVTVTFNPAFNSVPDGDVIDTWINPSNPQMVTGAITSISKTGCTAQIMISKGTLLLAAGPFQTAPLGTSTIIRVIGN